MKIILASLATPVLYAAAGFGWISVCRTLAGASVFERLAYSFLLGVTVVTLPLFGLSHVLGVGLTSATTWLVIAVAVVASISVWLAKRHRGYGAPIEKTERLWILAVVVVALAAIALSIARPPFGWDFRMTWSAHARYFHEAGSVLPEAFVESDIFVVHPQYPPLTSLMQVVAYHLGGRAEDCLVGPTYVGFWIAFVGLVYGGVRRLTNSAKSAMMTAIIPLAIPWFLLGEGGALSGYADLPLACFFGAALIHAAGSKSRTGGVLEGVLLSAAVFTKNEGLVLVMAYLSSLILVSLLFESKRQALVRRIAITGMLVALASVWLVAWQSQIPKRFSESHFDSVASASWLGEDFVALTTEVIPAAGTVVAKPRWLALILALGVFGWLGRRELRRPVAIVLAAAWVLGNTAYLVVYWANPWPGNMVYLVTVTFERLQLQISVPLLVLLGITISGWLRQVQQRETVALPRV